MFGYLAGLEANRLSDYVMRFTAGACAAADGSHIVTFPTAQNDVDLQSNGLWGLDVGNPQAGVGIFPYVVYNASTEVAAILMSASITYGGVTCPSGFSPIRKLPFGIVLQADGIPAFHASHFPKPAITFTDAQAPALVMQSDDSAEGKTCSLSRWVPDNARLVWLDFDVGWRSNANTSNRPRAGSAYIRTPGTTLWRQVGNQNKVSGVRGFSSGVPIRVSSTLRVGWRTTGDSWLTITPLRYEMTEPMC